jgi:D-beta-D-heptose 7-phosphate kinase/D-beta-D-heptose 1-phosphate adenosyltransferase
VAPKGSDRTRLEAARLEKVLEAFSKVRLLVAGDVVLDEYLWGTVERVSPEAPVPVVHVQRESLVLGGAGNVVRNVVALGGQCRFCTVVGDDADGGRVLELLEELGVDRDGVVVAEGRPTTRKTRVIARSQQVVRFDRETHDALPNSVARRVGRVVDAELPQLDGAILEDYGKGLFSPRLIRRLMTRLVEAGVPVSVDPKERLFAFRGASLLKPNLREAEAATGVRVRAPGDLERLGERLRRRLGGSAIVITRGADGVTVFEGDAPGVDVPTVSQDVFDVQGAGDTSIAALTLALRAGASTLEAAVIANAAAGVVVEKIGTSTADREEVRALLPASVAVAREGR